MCVGEARKARYLRGSCGVDDVLGDFHGGLLATSGRE